MGTVLLDYHFMNIDVFLALEERGWLEKMKILYAKDNTVRTRAQKKLESALHIRHSRRQLDEWKPGEEGIEPTIENAGKI